MAIPQNEEKSPARTQQVLWVNETTQPGRILVGSTMYVIRQHDWPHDEMMETRVIAAMLAAGEGGNGNAAMSKVAFLQYNDFFFKRHAFVWKAMKKLHKSNTQIDIATVSNELREANVLEKIGGEAALIKLANINAVSLESYATKIQDYALRRAMIVAADFQRDLAYQRGELPEIAAKALRVQQEVTHRIFNIGDKQSYDLADALETYIPQLRRELEDQDYTPGISTGFYHVDKYFTFEDRRLYIFSGPPGHGKTALLFNVAVNAAKMGKNVELFSLELGLNELLDRIICAEAGINNRKLNRRKLNANEIERLGAAAQLITQLRKSGNLILEVLDFPLVEEVRASIEVSQLRRGVDLVVVDYVGYEMMDCRINGRRPDNRTHQSYLWTEFRRMKKDYDIPIVAGAQLNREFMKRKNKRPRKEDLFESSIAEKAADVVGIVRYPCKYDEDAETDYAEFFIEKHRSGETGMAKLTFEAPFYRFSNYRNPELNR
jgi:replicative DNA helicase